MLRALLVTIVLAFAAVAGGQFAHAGTACLGAGGTCHDDVDHDGIVNASDNCPQNRNADQLDTDGDAIGDACDPDDDNDEVPDGEDNCRVLHNPGQGEADCPATHSDDDGVRDEDDNCPRNSNADQADFDQDRLGDVCDADDDNDGVADYMDNCPRVDNASQEDRDGDKVGRACDPDEIGQPAEPTPEPGTGGGGDGGSGAGGGGVTSPGAAPVSDRTAPALSVSAVRTWTTADLRGGAPVGVRCSEACGITARLSLRGRLLAQGTAVLGGGGRTIVFFEPRRGALRRVTRLRGRVRASLTVRVVDEAGNRRSVTRRLWLRR